MKTTTLLCALGGENLASRFAWRWSASLLNRCNAAGVEARTRSIEFELDGESATRLAGRLRGLRVECRKGRLWITQSGLATDVILHPGQHFVALSDGAIVVQAVCVPPMEQNDRIANHGTRGPVAVGMVTTPARGARVAIVRPRGSVSPAATSFDWIRPGRAAKWELLAFGLVWLSALVAVGYCFGIVAGLPFPR